MDTISGLAAVRDVEVEILTDAYRVTGTIHTRFGRVTDILTQPGTSHVTLTGATVVEHAHPGTSVDHPSALVAFSSILVLQAPALSGMAGAEMRIQKQPVPVQLAIPPLRVVGTMHIPIGSQPIDGLLNMTDRFLTMTNASITSAAFPELDGVAEALAVSRDRAELIVVADSAKTWEDDEEAVERDEEAAESEEAEPRSMWEDDLDSGLRPA